MNTTVRKGANPYLPFWETVPDGEPHIYENRIYVYGSHDALDGTTFCPENFVAWSAPVEDPGDWRYEGVLYDKMQDPLNGAPYDGTLPDIAPLPLGTAEAPRLLYAPDVCRGSDGRYYLYYALDFTGVVSVAVADRPQGPYTFLEYVRRADGSIPQIGIWFDPAVLVEESGVYLYYGFAPTVRYPEQMGKEVPGALVVRLADDMHTIISEPVCAANGCESAQGTSYEEHPFFEAPSIRHIGNWYYLVYSSLQGHELCYAMAKHPEGPFTYKGVVISNADLGYEGNCEPACYYGNNHGGIERIGEEYYIFWHRQTHDTEFSRQGCADRIRILADGTIPQVEMTSCGLHGGPFPARGETPAYIACCLTPGEGHAEHVLDAGPGAPAPQVPEGVPYITEEFTDGRRAQEDDGTVTMEERAAVLAERDRAYAGQEPALRGYIRSLSCGAAAGYRYLAFDGTENRISLCLRGQGHVEVRLDRADGEMIASCSVDSHTWQDVGAAMRAVTGVHAVYIVTTEGTVDLAGYTIGDADEHH